MNMPVWKCKACGCLWRDNLDETVSLLNAEQKSCAVCEHTPTRKACEIHWLQVEPATPQSAGATKPSGSQEADAHNLPSALLRERPQEPTKDVLARTGEASTATGGVATASTDTKG